MDPLWAIAIILAVGFVVLIWVVAIELEGINRDVCSQLHQLNYRIAKVGYGIQRTLLQVNDQYDPEEDPDPEVSELFQGGDARLAKDRMGW